MGYNVIYQVREPGHRSILRRLLGQPKVAGDLQPHLFWGDEVDDVDSAK